MELIGPAVRFDGAEITEPSGGPVDRCTDLIVNDRVRHSTKPAVIEAARAPPKRKGATAAASTFSRLGRAPDIHAAGNVGTRL